MKLEFERQDIIEILKREAEKLLPQTPGCTVEVTLSGYATTATAQLIKEEDAAKEWKE